MEKISVEKDIIVLCVKASSFPDCIKDAFITLENKVGPEAKDRTFYGLSKPQYGIINYWAGIEGFSLEESSKFSTEAMVIQHGNYISEKILNWKNNGLLIGKTFERLLTSFDIDPSSFCIEVYNLDDSVTCMVKLIGRA